MMEEQHTLQMQTHEAGLGDRGGKAKQAYISRTFVGNVQT